ncbi:unnamed protein product [Gulo gulo]|uniref:Uncharacterized protein n=1 Tax=Gulo gulo TaxID=48420 RepID=A0A9X9LGH4_GULGU|nr:unnamed protein product [Gulo gulo]
MSPPWRATPPKIKCFWQVHLCRMKPLGARVG